MKARSEVFTAAVKMRKQIETTKITHSSHTETHGVTVK